MPSKEEPLPTSGGTVLSNKRSVGDSRANDSILPLPGTNAYSRWRAGCLPEIRPEQLADYLDKNARGPASLLAAFRSTGDKAFLQEAMQNYPSDPRVALGALLEGGSSKDDHRKWLDTLKGSAPDNALANYLSASDYLQAGQTSEAINELVTGSGKPIFQDYWADATQNTEEAYRAAGYSEAEAKTAATSLRVPEFTQLRGLDQGMLALAKTLGESGNQEEMQSVEQSGVALGQMLADPNARQSTGQYAMGMQIEQQFLSMMDPSSTVGQSRQTVKDQLAQISQQLQLFNSLAQKQGALLAGMSDQDLIDYADHLKVFGGLQALQWLANRQPNR
jgi:hypothetical protein